MRPVPAPDDDATRSEEHVWNERVQSFIRLMLSNAPSGSPWPVEPSPNGNGEEIILDADVDGARYILIRIPRPDRACIQLSPREQEIVRMVAKGHPNKIIADVLNISSWTVCTHLRRIFAKLGVGSRAAMVAQLLEIGRTRTPASSPGRGPSVRRTEAPAPAPFSRTTSKDRPATSAKSEPSLRRSG
jgi:DNA-binding CsgD family transcriptional regulator